jgi:hypothetical protein
MPAAWQVPFLADFYHPGSGMGMQSGKPEFVAVAVYRQKIIHYIGVIDYTAKPYIDGSSRIN